MEFLSPASFLIEIGKVLIAQFVLDKGSEADFKVKIKETDSIRAVEEEFAQTYTAEVSADIFNHWKFDEKLVNLVRFCGEPENLDEELQEASKALHVIRIATGLDGVFTDETLAAAKVLIEKYDLDLESFEAAIEKMSA
jgi:HD-like signal output (HDOD) protein